jgi:hypothetical protein
LVPGGGQTIAPLSALPSIASPLTIDGTIQPGYAGTPLIELNGSGTGSPVSGLTMTAGGSNVFGLAIDNFSGDEIDLHVAGGTVSVNLTTVTGNQALGGAGGAAVTYHSDLV